MPQAYDAPREAEASQAVAELRTVRDFLRWATSAFERAGLVYGHGTTEALDEAAFIVLEGLNLPIDRLDPFLDAVLLPAERNRLAALIEARVLTRKPAPYLLNKAYIRGVPFYVDERVIVPRSFIAEILMSDMFAPGAEALMEPAQVERALDLCAGSAAIAIIAARVFPDAMVDAVELSPDAADVARINIAQSGCAERIELIEGDLFAPVEGRLYDLILTNPPYVDAQAMGELPPEYVWEPAMALGSGEDGLDIVRRILAQARAHLAPQGALICEIGRGRALLESYYSDLPFVWLDTQDSQGEVFVLRAEDLPAD